MGPSADRQGIGKPAFWPSHVRSTGSAAIGKRTRDAREEPWTVHESQLPSRNHPHALRHGQSPAWMPVNICHVQALTCKPVSARKSAGEKHEAKMVPRGTKQPAEKQPKDSARYHSGYLKVLDALSPSPGRQDRGKPAFWASGVLSGLQTAQSVKQGVRTEDGAERHRAPA